MKLWVVASAVRPEMSTGVVIAGCSICLSMSVCPLAGQVKHPTACIPAPRLRTQPNPHGVVRRQVWAAVLLQPPSANMGLTGMSPRQHPSWDLHISSFLSWFLALLFVACTSLPRPQPPPSYTTCF